MKVSVLFKPVFHLCALPVLLALVTGGCSTTTKKVDWDSRVGSYTFDQAVSEMGPPDKDLTVSTGKKIAEWITHRGGGSSTGTGFSGGSTGVGAGQTVGPGYKDTMLRLTFNPDGKLESWSENY